MNYGYSTSSDVTQFDWLLVCINYVTNEEIVFHNDTPNKVYEFIQKNPILIGHNARYYDQYILKAILSGYSMSEIKALNDYIITGGQGFEFNFDFREPLAIWDTMQDIVPQKSLKEIEANLLLDITESTVSFDIDHLWTKEEYEEMLYYCRADVNALRPLFDARKGYFETKFDLCLLSNIEPRYNVGLTNAKLCAKFLEATKIDRTDERDYVIPKTIDTNYVDKRILEFFNKIYDDSISSEDLFSRKLEFEEHGMPSVVSWGGKHGALPNFIFEQEKEPKMILINADFESLYPHILALEEYNTISRNIKDKKKYYNTLQNRLKLKHEGKKKEQLALKLVLNTTYGCLLNQYNDLFDPRGARSTCINGQLLISELTERIYQIGDVQLVQVNTDGIMVKLPKSKLDTYYKVCDDFAKKVKINLEYDIIEKIIQKDVNNYILIMKDKNKYKIKAKGGYFSNLPNLSMDENKNIKSEYVPNFKTNTMAIVSEALARNLLLDTPIEETINNCNNINMFQIVNHIGNTYKKLIQRLPSGDVELQKNNRVYAGLEPTGTIYKVKPNGREDSLANQPPNPIIDNKNELTIDRIDKRWYIKIAKQRVNDFRGVKRIEDYKKDELLKYCEEHNIPTDKKMKKSEILKIVESFNAERDEKENSIKKPYKIDLTGKRYGSMVVTSFAYNKCKKSYWNCLCDCGKVFIKRQDILKNSKYMCCRECYYKLRPVLSTADKDTNNDAEYHRLYNIWTNMKRRCNVATNDRYDQYGGRGISICEEWYKSYKTFKLWALNNGYRNDLTIDRINNDGNYEPSNCRWVTNLEQMQNTSVSWYVKYKNATYSLAMLSRVLNIPRTTLRSYLLKYNFDVEKCIKIYKERGRRK